MVRQHIGKPITEEKRQRWMQLLLSTADEVGVPADPEFRAALRGYMEWAVADVLTFSAVGSSVPAGLPMPRWSLDGLEAPIAR